MANLAVAGLGAFVGFTIAGPFGAQIGFALGGAVGNALFGEKQRFEGPRLDDLRVMGMSYGSPISKVWGTQRVSGSIIWAADLIETENVQEQGKGGGGTEQVTYTYSADFAVALCEGPIVGVKRVWANGLLIYDAKGNPPVDQEVLPNFWKGLAFGGVAGGGMHTYTGSEDQQPNSLMETYLGVGEVPAYKGTAYVVFEGMQLEKFGNRLPQLSFEIVTEGAGEATELWRTSAGGYLETTNMVLLPNYIAFARGFAASPGDDPGIHFYNMTTQQIEWSAEINSYAAESHPLIPLNGENSRYLVMMDGPNSGGMTVVDMINRTSEYVTTSAFSTGLCSDFNTKYLWTWSFYSYDAKKRDIDGTVLETRNFPMSAVWASICTDDQNRLWGVESAVHDVLSPDTSLWVVDEANVMTTYTISGYGASRSCHFDYYRNSIIITTAKYNDDGYLVEFSLDTMTVVQAFHVHSPSNFCKAYPDNVIPGRWWVNGLDGTGTTANLVAIDLDAGEVALTIPYSTVDWSTESAPMIGVGTGVYVMVHDSNDSALVFFSAGGEVMLSSIVSEVCQMVSLDVTDINVGALTDMVRGYVMSRPMTARAAIEPLQQAYWFDGVESDYHLTFIKRGGSSVRSISEDDMVPRDGGPLVIKRTGELELPVEVRVRYSDYSMDYDPGMQYDRRLTVESDGVTTLDLPLVLTAEEGKRIAEVNLAIAWMSRTGVEFSTTIENVDLDPTDIISLPIENSITDARITRFSFGQQRVEFDAVLDDPSIYQPAGFGVPSSQQSSSVLQPIAYTKMFMIDSPPLRDADDALLAYAAAGGAGYGRWRGAGIYYSADGGSTYVNRTTITNQVTHGTITDVLPSTTVGNVFDDDLVINVLMLNGSLASASKVAVLNGANAIWVGGELIQFTTATLVAANHYTISGILRGRKGTEWAMSGHYANEPFVLLEASKFVRLDQQYADFEQLRLYKPVTVGHSLSQTSPQEFTLEGNSKKPLAPVHLSATRDGSDNITINWVRRTRIDGEWRDLVDAGLGEAAESYEVEIYNTSFSSLKRTISVSAQTASYTAAQQTTDFGSPQSSVGVKIYQVSQAIGRGHPAEEIL